MHSLTVSISPHVANPFYHFGYHVFQQHLHNVLSLQAEPVLLPMATSFSLPTPAPKHTTQFTQDSNR